MFLSLPPRRFFFSKLWPIPRHSFKIQKDVFFPADTPQKVDHIYRARCFAYSRISSKTQLFRLRKAVEAIFYFTINQTALFPSEYTIDQPRFQANIPTNQGFSQKGVQLSYGRPFLEEIQEKYT